MKTVMVMVVLAFSFTRIVGGKPHTCECSVFKLPSPANRTDQPIISKSFPFILCDDFGGLCQKFCISVAHLEKENAGTKLCPLLVSTSKPFMSYVYYRLCGGPEWIYTGLVPTVKVCCSDKVEVSCNK